MPKKYERKYKQTWTKDQMSQAITEIESGGSIRVAKKFSINESTIRSRLERKKISGVSFIGFGRPTVFSKKIENQLATCIKKMCSVGFSPTTNEVKKLVQEYVKDNNISTPFTDTMPGKGWFNGFMSRNKILLKKSKLHLLCQKICYSKSIHNIRFL